MKAPLNTVTLFMAYYAQAHSLVACVAKWDEFGASKNPAVAEASARIAEQKRSLLRLSGSPVEFRFTSIDGRIVDLLGLRGKVVLIDFWATWCVPCMEEMPHVREAFARYHDRGFEVIGVSCDVAPASVVRSAHPGAKTADDVLAFTRKHAMPWPHYYDGKKQGVANGNALAAKFGVTGIPATFLLNRKGLIVASGLRGEQLYQAIERELASPD